MSKETKDKQRNKGVNMKNKKQINKILIEKVLEFVEEMGCYEKQLRELKELNGLQTKSSSKYSIKMILDLRSEIKDYSKQIDDLLDKRN